MKKVLFLVSHLGSGSDQIYNQLCENIVIQGYQNKNIHKYSNMMDIMYLTESKHKLKTTSRIYMDHLLYNFQFSCKEAYKYCKFIYFIGDPIKTINYLVKDKIYLKKQAVLYYLYRVRRICEMAKRSSDFVFLTPSLLRDQNKLNDLQKFLNLKEEIEFKFEDYIYKGKEILSFQEEELLDKSYEKYLFFLNKISN